MSVRRRLTAHLSAVVMTALLGGTLFTSTLAFVAPSPVAAWPGGCDSKQKVAFIAFPSVNGLEDMQTPLRKLSNIWPVKKLVFRYMNAPLDNSPSGIDAAVNELEGRVNYLEAHGYNRIGLPSISSVLAPFIHGTAGSLGGVPLETRHPNSVFVTINSGTSATEDNTEAGNVFRLVDVPSENIGIEVGVQKALGPGGEMEIIYQQGDAVSESIRDEFIGIASDLGVTEYAEPVAFDGSNFNSANLDFAKGVEQNTLPAGSLVVHIVNGLLSDQYVTDATPHLIFTDTSSNGPIRHFAGNFYPSTALPVDLEFGYTPVDFPSWQSAKAGFPTKTADWQADSRQKEYMDAFGFLAKCGKFHGVLDGFLRFDAGGTRINKQLERGYRPANSTTFTAGEVIDNQRWYDDQVVFDWKTVFGQ